MTKPSKLLKNLTLITLIWASMVILLGAYTRLTDAGLGCPDWPGCYGHLSVPTSTSVIHHIDAAHPAAPLVAHKAWAEMIHRYFAGTLGLLILAVVILGTKYAVQSKRKSLLVALISLFILLIYQPVLGMWTVTLKLLPIIVSQHLLGGMSIFALLCLLYLAWQQEPYRRTDSPIQKYAIIGLMLVFGQIALGAWTSTNYAAIACPDFPFCQLTPWHWDFHGAFHLFSTVGVNYDGGVLSDAARKTIQMTHRIGALTVTVYLFVLCSITMMQQLNHKLLNAIFVVMFLLFIQIGLGIANVLLERPLIISVCHNLTAALILMSMVRFSYLTYVIPQHESLSENQYQPA